MLIKFIFELDAKLYMFSWTSRKTHKAVGIIILSKKIFFQYNTVVKILKPNNGKNK